MASEEPLTPVELAINGVKVREQSSWITNVTRNGDTLEDQRWGSHLLTLWGNKVILSTLEWRRIVFRYQGLYCSTSVYAFKGILLTKNQPARPGTDVSIIFFRVDKYQSHIIFLFLLQFNESDDLCAFATFGSRLYSCYGVRVGRARIPKTKQEVGFQHGGTFRISEEDLIHCSATLFKKQKSWLSVLWLVGDFEQWMLGLKVQSRTPWFYVN